MMFDPGATPAGKPCDFSYRHYRELLVRAQTTGYETLTCAAVAGGQRPREGRVIVLRHDVDELPERSLDFGEIEAEHRVTASYFFRVHSNTYNALSHEVSAIIRRLAAMGHEVGLHAEPTDYLRATGVTRETSLLLGKHVLEQITGVEVTGVASHNDITPDNNLDWLSAQDITRYGFTYEAYDDRRLALFRRSRYVTDGHLWYWRMFRGGAVTDDRRCACAHLDDDGDPIYLLIHPHIWYRHHYHRHLR